MIEVKIVHPDITGMYWKKYFENADEAKNFIDMVIAEIESRLTTHETDCGYACGYAAPYGFVPECGCPVHDKE